MLVLFHLLSDYAWDSDLILPTMILLAALYATHYLLASSRRRPVAYPGGPRPIGKYRQPQWKANQKTTATKHPLAPGWYYSEGNESHDLTHQRFRHTITPDIRLTGEPAGRQTWHFTAASATTTTTTTTTHPFDPHTNPNSADLIYRTQQLNRVPSAATHHHHSPVVPPPPVPSPSATQEQRAAGKAAYLGASFYSRLQCDDGHWGGDYGGPMFLMPGIVIVAYVTDSLDELLPLPHRHAMVVYLRNHQQTDGGWGTHIESPSTMFGTTLSYVTMRLLGVKASDKALQTARAFMTDHGGALYTSSWAKFWLSVLGVYDWNGINSIPTEMWLLPEWFPFHPSKMWCHSRMVYLPMGYIYGTRWVYPGAAAVLESNPATVDPIISDLRNELYEGDYATIQWDKHRHDVAAIDNYSPITWYMRLAHNVLSYYEWFGGIRCLRQRGLKFVMDYIHAEDVQTNYIDIGPVNKTMNMLSVYIDATMNGDQDIQRNIPFQNHKLRIDDYLWVAEDGMKMQGYNGSQCWDTSFAARAMAEGGLTESFPTTVQQIWSFLERTQILSTEISSNTPAARYESLELRTKYFRHVSKGGWPFSTSAHGWPISDCTSEGLKAVLVLRRLPCIVQGIAQQTIRIISDQRLYDGINVILTMQNTDGGWATYENTRGGGWYEGLNPSEVFGEIMIDYSYVECTSASVCCLIDFQEQFPNHRSRKVQQSIQLGRSFVRAIQRPDGSWYGSWACCFTYGTWFGIEALVYGCEDHDHPVYQSTPVVKAIDFLLSKQNDNGGWGEDFTSCYDKSYAINGAEQYGTGGSSVVQTSWALLALLAAKCTNRSALDRGALFLQQMQHENGDWPQEGISGVFNRACGITYTQYRNVFSMWALGRYSTMAQN